MMMMMKLHRELILLAWLWTVGAVTSQNVSGTLDEKKQIYNLVDWTVVTPHWLDKDEYDASSRDDKIRYPYHRQRYGTTLENHELRILSQDGSEVVPSGKRTLEIQKKARRLLSFQDYRPIKSTGAKNYHAHAEKQGVRRTTLRFTDDMLIPMLYLPTGWPLTLFLIFLGWIFFVPLLGAILVEGGFIMGGIYKYILWGPVKRFLRMIVIRQELNRQSWIRFLAPPYYLKTRSTWKMPYLLRHEYAEDIPPELAYKPPINKIDYSLYTMNEDDFDEVDLEMDELEFIDEMLKFKDDSPSAVARLLKHRLGVEKFYNYFDEDLLSDEEDIDLLVALAAQQKKNDTETPEEAAEREAEMQKQQEEEDASLEKAILESDEPWMHPEFDITFEGTPYELEEIRRRREMLTEIKEEILYINTLFKHNQQYSEDKSELSSERRIKLQVKARKLLERYMRYSTLTKERVAEVEPSSKVQTQHNIALNKYLPLINKESHFNHRLNIRHEKQRDPHKRALQLNIFGGP